VGEVRALAIAPGNADVVNALCAGGWLAADGQLVRIQDFPELYATIGRAWTADGVRADQFAVPELHDNWRSAVSSDDPFGVLGPGDLVSSGRGTKQWEHAAPLSYWIFTGRSVGNHIVPVTGR
jgi:hypothetical protein